MSTTTKQVSATPGPWWTGTDEDSHMIYAGDGDAVASTLRDDGDAAAEEANARLYASAPDLLRELREGHISAGLDEIPEQHVPLEDSLDSLAEDIDGTEAGEAWSDWLRGKAQSIRNAIAKAEGTPRIRPSPRPAGPATTEGRSTMPQSVCEFLARRNRLNRVADALNRAHQLIAASLDDSTPAERAAVSAVDEKVVELRDERIRLAEALTEQIEGETPDRAAQDDEGDEYSARERPCQWEMA